jgi:hypothetical protein
MWCYRKFLALFTRKCEEEPLEVTPIGVTSTENSLRNDDRESLSCVELDDRNGSDYELYPPSIEWGM